MGLNRLQAFVLAVAALGGFVLLRAFAAIELGSLSIYMVLLAILTLASSRFSIKVPNRPATVSVSEVFVFALVVLFGPAPAAVTVALDGLCTSLTQRNRRFYRGLFNVAEPAISTWTAGTVFIAISGLPLLSPAHASTPRLLLATIALAAVYFVLNSGLTAIAMALESRTSVVEVWRPNAAYVAINIYAAASIAMLVTGNGTGLNWQTVGLIVPLMILSYVAYNEATARVDEANQHLKQVEHWYHSAVEMLAIAVDTKDQVTHGHIRRVQRHTVAVARALGVTNDDELKAIEGGSLLHDIGKLAVPDYVLNKPGALSPAEFEIIKLHVTLGAKILGLVEFPYPVVPIVRHHHEWWNGAGYPDGLKGSDIPFGARILAVVDCFDALTSDRPYRPKLSDSVAIDMLRANSGIAYDPEIVEKFIELVPALRRADRAAEEQENSVDAVVGGDRVADPRRSDSRSAIGPVGPYVETMINDRVAHIPSAEACLFALNASGDHLVVAHATPGMDERARSTELPIGRSLSGWVAANRSTIRNSDPTLDFRDLASAIGLGSCTSTPVFALGELVGVLTVYVKKKNGFSDEDVRLVCSLAQEIGLRIARIDDGPGRMRVRPVKLRPAGSPQRTPAVASRAD
jgi:putative nucleotidyltransferase with HDIG domain